MARPHLRPEGGSITPAPTTLARSVGPGKPNPLPARPANRPMNLRLHPLLLLPLISVGIARAADEPPPACTIDRARAADGRFDFRMERTPTDGRVAVPTALILLPRLTANQDTPVPP